MELHEVHVLTWPVFRDLEQVHNAHEPGLASEFGRDVSKADRKDGIDLDLALLHSISVARDDVRTLPDPDAAGDVATTNAVA
jgi:hypothetical protein